MTEPLIDMPVTRQTQLDPPLEYTQLRETQPIVRVRLPNHSTGWLVTRLEEGFQVFSDSRMSSRIPRHDILPGEIDEPGQDAPFEGVLVGMDSPEHGKYRRLLSGHFTPRSVQIKLQPYIDRIIDEHLDAIAAGPETFDLVQALALPIPCLVICELLGVPYADRDGFHHATDLIMNVSRTPEERHSGFKWLADYITHLVQEKRRTGDSQGLLAELIKITDAEGSILTDQQLIALGVLLLFAGHDTTAAMIGLSALTLLTHDKQRQELVEHPEKIDSAVEELLRYLTIVQFGLGRVAKEDLEMGGQQIKQGELVMVAMNAANRDPRAFDHPNLLDFDRKIVRHIAFGYGIHLCLGQHVARAELKAILPRLFQRFPNLKLAVPAEEVPMDTYAINYGVRQLLVTR